MRTLMVIVFWQGGNVRISVTISEGSVLEAKLKAFNKHERSALVKMALTKWFCDGNPPVAESVESKKTLPESTKQVDVALDPLKHVMGDFSD